MKMHARHLALPIGLAAALSWACGGGNPPAVSHAEPETLAPGTCWTDIDCAHAPGNPPATLCSLYHTGAAPGLEACTHDRDCQPGTRCVPVAGGRACSPPGVCQPCCRPGVPGH